MRKTIKSLALRMGWAFLWILAFSQVLAGQPETKGRYTLSRKGFFVGLQALRVSNIVFPSAYDMSSPGIIDLAGESWDSSAGFPMSVSLGYSFNMKKKLFAVIRLDFAQMSFSDADEQLLTHWAKSESFVQSGRKLGAYLLSFSLGFQPFKSVALAFYGGVGAGYMRKTFHSGMCEAYASKADLVKLRRRDCYDLGEINNNGDGVKELMSVQCQMRMEYFLMKKISIEIDSNIIWAFDPPRFKFGHGWSHGTGPTSVLLKQHPPTYSGPDTRPIIWIAAGVAYHF